MKERIAPVGLKGNEINERIKSLMGVTQINENNKKSVLELTKVGPDGRVYGIVRENHEYFIKTTNKKNNLIVEDFAYIGGLQNKKQEAYPSYAKAIKHLNLKFNSLNNAYDKSGQINVFENDNLSSMHTGFSNEGNLDTNTMSECCGAQMMEGMCMECGGASTYGGMEEFDKPAMHSFQNQYGDEKGEDVYYATANKQDRSPETFEKNEGMYMEDELSDKQKRIASLAGNPNKIDADDFSALRGGAHIEEEEGLDSVQQDVHDMMEDEYMEQQMYENKKKTTGKLSIARSIDEMDSIIESVVNRKKKVYTLK